MHTTTITYWKEYATAAPPAAGPHMSNEAVGATISVAAVVAMPLVFASGKLLDVVGRRIGATASFLATSVSCVAAYTIEAPGVAMTIAVIGAIFGVSAVLPVLNAYNTELFPTHLRANAFAWANNIFGRIGYVLAPWAVGEAAEVFGYGPAVAVTAIGPVIALILILWLLPETKDRELEDTANL